MIQPQILYTPECLDQKSGATERKITKGKKRISRTILDAKVTGKGYRLRSDMKVYREREKITTEMKTKILRICIQKREK